MLYRIRCGKLHIWLRPGLARAAVAGELRFWRATARRLGVTVAVDRFPVAGAEPARQVAA